MINSINLLLLRNAEYIQFNRNLLDLIKLNNKTTLKVAAEYDALDTIISVIEAIFKTDQGSNITPVIEALDARRDSAVWGIYKNIDSYTHHFTPAQIDAANVLTDYLKIYGTPTEVATSSLPAETAIVINIVTDVANKANLAAAVATLGLGTWFAELKTANDLLDAKYLERTVELGGANPNTIKDKRNEANNMYYALRDMVQGQATVDKGATAAFATTINQLNALIDQYNAMLNNRAADAAAKKKVEEPKVDDSN